MPGIPAGALPSPEENRPSQKSHRKNGCGDFSQYSRRVPLRAPPDGDSSHAYSEENFFQVCSEKTSPRIYSEEDSSGRTGSTISTEVIVTGEASV